MENYKQVLISNKVWEQLENYCKQTGRTKKGFIEYLIKEYFNNN